MHFKVVQLLYNLNIFFKTVIIYYEYDVLSYEKNFYSSTCKMIIKLHITFKFLKI